MHHDPVSEQILADDLPPGTILSVSNEHIRWGGSAFLLGQLRAVAAAKQAGAGWIVVLSAQDYPVQSLREFEKRLLRCSGDALLETFEAQPDYEGILSRYSRQGIELSDRVDRLLRRPALSAVVKGSRVLKHQRRPRGMPGRLERRYAKPPLPPGMRVTAGSNWWTLGPRAVDVLLAHYEGQSPLLRHFLGTYIASEAFVHTALALERQIVVEKNHKLHYIVWQNWSPVFLTERDMPELLSGEVPFARKFEAGAPVLDLLDQHLERSKGRGIA